MAYTYILRCEDGELYVGSTEDMDVRFKTHVAKRGSKFTKTHKPVEIVYTEQYDTYQEAFKRERQLHGWSRAKKEALIAGDIEKLKELSNNHK